MYYSIDGRLEKSNEKNYKKVKEDFINIPFFQFTSATNAGLRSTSDINVDKDANIKGDINLDGKMIKGGEEIDITKLSSEEFNIKNLKVGGTSVLSGKVGVGSSYVNNSLTVVGLDKYTTDGNRLSTHFGYGQFRIYFGSENTVSDESKGNDESKGKYDNRAHLDIGYNIGKIGNPELGGAYLQTQVDFVGHTPICINPMGGNVGVGTNNPVYKLDVNGDIRIPQRYANDGASSKLLFYSNPGFGEAGINFVGGALYNEQGSSYLNIFVRGVNAIAIQSGGNVGIGTTKPSAKLHVNVGNSSKDKSKKALNVYKDFNGVDNGNYVARIYGLDHKIKETGIRICEKGGSSLKSSSTKVLDVYSNGSSVMNVRGDGKLTVNGGLQANSINPFPGNDSGTYYSRWNFHAKKRLTHFICAFQVDNKNVQTTMEIDFCMVYTRSKNGTHNRNQRSAGKLIFNMVSTSPSNQHNAGRSDGNWYVRYSCDNSNYVVDGQMGTGPGFYFLRKNDSCYLLAAIGQSRSDGGNYTGMFKVNIMDPFLQGFHMFTDNETKKAAANVEPHECHKYDPNNQRPDNYKEDNFPGEYKFVDKDYHTWMKIGDGTTGSASFKQKYNETKYDQEINSPN